MTPEVRHVFHGPSYTFSYVVWDAATRRAAIIDPVLDYDPASGRTDTKTAQQILDIVQAEDLSVDWLLETHAHADHIMAAAWLKAQWHAPIAIGERITEVQARFAWLFNLGSDFSVDGRQFDRLFADGDAFAIGDIPVQVIHTPGHTSDHVSYVIGDAVFVGDTLFLPDAGTARCDFPAGSAKDLYRSIHTLFDRLPDTQRLFVLHDYGTEQRVPAFETTIGDQRQHNIHVGGDAREADFVAIREARDQSLPMPTLILPAVQVNIRAGVFPPPEANGVSYLKIPIDTFTAHWQPPG